MCRSKGCKQEGDKGDQGSSGLTPQSNSWSPGQVRRVPTTRAWLNKALNDRDLLLRLWHILPKSKVPDLHILRLRIQPDPLFVSQIVELRLDDNNPEWDPIFAKYLRHHDLSSFADTTFYQNGLDSGEWGTRLAADARFQELSAQPCVKEELTKMDSQGYYQCDGQTHLDVLEALRIMQMHFNR